MLHEHIRSGDRASIEALLLSGIDVDEKDDKYRTPLHLAVWKGDAAVVELLLYHEADVKLKAMDNFTALHFAAQNGSRLICEYLVNREKTLLDMPTSKAGKTALHLAIGKGHIDVVKYLLEAGASTKVKTKQGENALALAWKCNTHQGEMVELIKTVHPIPTAKTKTAPSSSPMNDVKTGISPSVAVLGSSGEVVNFQGVNQSMEMGEDLLPSHHSRGSDDAGLLPSTQPRKKKRIDSASFLSHLTDPE